KWNRKWNLPGKQEPQYEDKNAIRLPVIDRRNDQTLGNPSPKEGTLEALLEQDDSASKVASTEQRWHPVFLDGNQAAVDFAKRLERF
ncbi:MAG TPA: hypothetical protein VE242_12440, partial [Chthoniobacterales bacterium]|nr:hypothetical protein [Chthoniobacterales bacterium]